MKDFSMGSLISRRPFLGKSILAGYLSVSPRLLWARADKAVGEVAQSARFRPQTPVLSGLQDYGILL